MNLRLMLPGVALFALAVSFGACGGKKPPIPPPPAEAPDAAASEDASPPAPKSLYDRLGGKDAIAAVVDKFLENVTLDPRVNKVFIKTKGPKLDAFKKNLIDQICEIAGAPKDQCTYTGKDMRTAHRGMKITDAQFDAAVSDLRDALGELKVPDQEQKDLLDKVGTLRDDVVEIKAKPKQ
jgi:hemoglobin